VSMCQTGPALCQTSAEGPDFFADEQ